MWFDVNAALAKIENQDGVAATTATTATLPPKTHPNVADVANVAGGQLQIPKTALVSETDDQAVLEAIERGNSPGSKWQPRPGSISMETGLGGTVTYQLIDRLIEQGRVEQAPDGVLSIKGAV